MDLGLLVLARALHILAGITWTGATLITAFALVPVLIGQTTQSPWFAAISRRIGPMAMITSVVTVVTGIYLFVVLHAHDTTTGGIVLTTGALMGLIAVPSGIMIGRTVSTREAHLTGASGDAAQIAAARAKLRMHARISTVLQVLSVLAMATFRYASAL